MFFDLAAVVGLLGFRVESWSRFSASSCAQVDDSSGEVGFHSERITERSRVLGLRQCKEEKNTYILRGIVLQETKGLVTNEMKMKRFVCVVHV